MKEVSLDLNENEAHMLLKSLLKDQLSRGVDDENLKLLIVKVSEKVLEFE
ncbi:hypothetical protein P4639_22505 [Priestia megaterium]|nr:hypothetical protein [Priestia megaterium]